MMQKSSGAKSAELHGDKHVGGGHVMHGRAHRADMMFHQAHYDPGYGNIRGRPSFDQSLHGELTFL